MRLLDIESIESPAESQIPSPPSSSALGDQFFIDDERVRNELNQSDYVRLTNDLASSPSDRPANNNRSGSNEEVQRSLINSFNASAEKRSGKGAAGRSPAVRSDGNTNQSTESESQGQSDTEVTASVNGRSATSSEPGNARETTSPQNGIAPEETTSPEQNVAQQERSISNSIKNLHQSYILPSEAVKSPFLAAGTFIAGFVIDSIGSVTRQKSGDHMSSPVTPAKVQKIVTKKRNSSKGSAQKSTHWHAIFLGDEERIIKVWCRSTPESSAERSKSVRRLSELKLHSFAAIYIETGPVELSYSNPAFKRYELCDHDVELKTLKAKEIDIRVGDGGTTIPEFAAALGNAISIDSWAEVDSVVASSNSFEVNCSFAVLSLNGKHAHLTARNGTRYLNGYLQDKTGVTRYFSVWASIPEFISKVPDNVDKSPVVMRFTRLRVRTMGEAGFGNYSRVASVTSKTMFEVLDISYEAFTNKPESGTIQPGDLDGFF